MLDTRITVAIADDHPILREGLRRLLESDPTFEIVGEAADGVEAVALVASTHPDVLLLDLVMPRMGGLDVLTALAPNTTHVVILTAAIDGASVRRALELGAAGILLKETASRQLLADIGRVASGDFVVGPAVLSELTSVARLQAAPSPRPFNLTARELEIASAVADGQCNRDIAAKMGITVQTVKHHLTSIFSKTGVATRLELALFALRHGIGA